MRNLLSYQLSYRHRIIFRMLMIMALMMSASGAWAQKHTWDATTYGTGDVGDDYQDHIEVKFTNICVSNQIERNRNFQAKDYMQGKITVIVPFNDAIYSIKIWDDYKEGRDLTLSPKNSNYTITSTANSCTIQLKETGIGADTLVCELYKGTTKDDKDGTNFRYLEVVYVNKNTAEFAKASYTVDAKSTVATSFDRNYRSGMSATYESSNTNIATVNSSGEVTGVGAGTATITAKIKGGERYDYKEATTKVTVNRIGSG